MPTPKQTRIYVFLGSDEARVREEAQKCVHGLVPDGEREFGLEIVEGQADHADHALEICSRVVEGIQTLPFLGGNKVVWLKGANFLGDTQTGKAAATIEGQELLLEQLKAGLPGDVTFVLSASEIDKRRALYKGLSKLTKVTILDRPDVRKSGWQEAVASLVRERAASRDLQFVPAAMDRFVATVSEDSGQIESEIEKIDLFLGPDQRTVSPETVAEIASETRAGIVFEISSAIAARDLGLAISRVDYLLGRGDNGIGILRAAVIPEIRKLLGAALIRPKIRSIPGQYPAFQSMLEGLPQEITSQLSRTKAGKLNAYPLFLALSGPDLYSSGELVAALEAVLDTDHKMVSTSLDHRLLLTRLLTIIIGGKPSQQGRAA